MKLVILIGILLTIAVLCNRDKECSYVHNKTGTVYLFKGRKDDFYILQSTETGEIINIKEQELNNTFSIKWN